MNELAAWVERLTCTLKAGDMFNNDSVVHKTQVQTTLQNFRLPSDFLVRPRKMVEHSIDLNTSLCSPRSSMDFRAHLSNLSF